jgi:hypothetical protein
VPPTSIVIVPSAMIDLDLHGVGVGGDVGDHEIAGGAGDHGRQ